ncbi:MAG: C2 family cysteine protease, partial [Janthinobacterium lividum]
MSVNQTLYMKEAGDESVVSINDVNQGWIGDCFVCAPIASLAFARPDYVQNMIRDNGNGTQSVRLYLDSWLSSRFTIAADNSSWITVRDSDLGNGMNTNNGGQLIVNGVQEIWPQVIENAIAQVAGGYDILNYGGFPAPIMYQLTGVRPTETFISPMWGSDYQPTTEQLRDDLAEKQMVNFFTAAPNEYSLVSNHVYSLTFVDDVNGVDYAHFRNPWGYGDPAP